MKSSDLSMNDVLVSWIIIKAILFKTLCNQDFSAVFILEISKEPYLKYT